ncbi:MAG: HypC/HybG/HupF family hydrogenase formation chaperone [Peptococcaceae bacterium]|jgi:hydrogenase expression/formation protein HypC|nr:HypC/HybG/HupF family hydrogenase formation chaperone [Peptococcaceae bacterium]
MCLAVPGRVAEILGGNWVLIETFGLTGKVGTHLVGEVAVGDYLVVHAGYAIEKLDLEEARERIRIWEELLAHDAIG